MRNKFDNELMELNHKLVKMGSLCEYAISLAMKCFEINSDVTVEMVKNVEIQIDEFENEIERQCLKLLLQQQPVAKDLRMISSVLKMITDLERIGDQAVDISEMSKYSKNINLHIKKMAEVAITMLSLSIDAFVKSDIELANQAIKKDDVVDSLFLSIRCDIINEMKIKTDDAELALDMLMISKYLERIADHAVNVSEWVIFSITGLHKGESYDSNTRG